LNFNDLADYDLINQGDTITISDIAGQLDVGKPISAAVHTANGKIFNIALKHNLSDEDIKIIRAGGILNCV
jgi:aconitate hydratase